jgi:hypothetical protein
LWKRKTPERVILKCTLKGKYRNPIPHNWPDHVQQRYYHHTPTAKPQATTAVVELLMMDVRTPETC